MKNLALICIFFTSAVNAAEETEEEASEENQDFDIVFLIRSLTDSGVKQETWECGSHMQVQDKVMFLTVIIKSEVALKEKWQPRKFNSATHTIHYIQPTQPGHYYPISLVPKTPEQDQVWPSEYHVNKAMFDKLRENFTIKKVPPPRYRIRLFKVIPLQYRPSAPDKQAKSATQEILGCGFFYCQKNKFIIK